jgi:hypothetical protein
MGRTKFNVTPVGGVAALLVLDPPAPRPGEPELHGRWVTRQVAEELGIRKSFGRYSCGVSGHDHWFSAHALTHAAQACRQCVYRRWNKKWSHMWRPAVLWLNVPRDACPDTYNGPPAKRCNPRIATVRGTEEEALKGNHTCGLCSHCLTHGCVCNSVVATPGCCVGIPLSQNSLRVP